MFLWFVGFINGFIAFIELIDVLQSKSRLQRVCHFMLSIMWSFYSLAAFKENIIWGMPGLIFGILAVYLRIHDRSKQQ